MKPIYIFIVALACSVNCIAQKQAIIYQCPITHWHENKFYSQNKKGQRIYFRTDSIGKVFNILLEQKVISYKELFKALRIKAIKNYQDTLYCREDLIDYNRNDITSIASINFSQDTFDHKHPYSILLDIEVQTLRFTVVCIPIKQERSIENIFKSDVNGRVAVCMVDL